MNPFAKIDILFEAQLCVGIRVAIVEYAERHTGKILTDKMIVAPSYETTGDGIRPQLVQNHVAIREAATIPIWNASAASKCI
jgi:hypothetical protein